MKFLKPTIYLLVFLSLAFFAKGALAANNVYYSVGQNTSDHRSCTYGDCVANPLHVTVSGTTATFDVAQTAANMGVGDVITYGGNTCYISGKTSTTVWSCTNATGGTPTAASGATVTNIAHAFSSLNAALPSGSGGAKTLLGNSDLTAIDVALNIPCYYDSGPDQTAVTIDGWTTDATRYIKVYTPNNISTEVNQSQRHQGKWSTGRYSLSVNSNYDFALTIGEQYVRIEGLQILNSGTINAGGVHYAPPSAGELQFSYNIVKVAIQTSAARAVFDLNYSTSPAAGSTVKMWNNILYDGGYAGILWDFGNSGQTFIIYNNTLVDTTTEGIRILGPSGSVNLYLKNNLIQGSATNYYVTNFTNYQHSNNISEDTTSPDSSYWSKAVTFLDEANDDFHLSNTDTNAKDQGTDLSGDPYLAFTTDIDGSTRTGTWDIGADEAAIPIYRSVGPSAAAALETGSAQKTLTISSSTATFTYSSGGVPDNVGVGDVIQYNISGTYYLAFIYARASSTSYTVKTASGGAPTATTNNQSWDIYRAYTSLYNAERGSENTSINSSVHNFDTWSNGKDLPSFNEQWNIACYANGTTVDTMAVAINDWITSPTNYIKVYTPTSSSEVGTNQRHQGKWDDTKYRLSVASAEYSSALYINEEYVRVEGLQIERTGAVAYISNGLGVGVISDDSNIRISHNIIRSTMTGTSADYIAGIRVREGQIYIWNNIIYGWRGTGIYLTESYTSLTAWYVYNNTIYGGTGTYGYGIWQYNTNGSAIIKNNLCDSNAAGDYSGTWATSDTNLSSDVTSPQTNLRNKNPIYIDEANKDFHLASNDNDAKDQGTDLRADSNLAVATDIDGSYRGGNFDIGADEVSVEFTPTVMQSGGDYSSLYAWEEGVKTDLTAASTLVFSGTRSAAISDNIPVYLCRYSGGTYQYQTVSANNRHATTTQILVQSISNTTFAYQTTPNPDRWYSVSNCSGNYFEISNKGDPAIAVAKIDGAWTSADTSAVSIDGWTTSFANYIRIYTTAAARHSGKWDTGKYRLEVTNPSTASIVNYEDYVRIDGLQVKITMNNDLLFRSAIQTQDNGNCSFSDNIVVGNISGASYGIRGIFVNSGTGTHKVWNNIVYGFINGSNTGLLGIGIGTGATLYAYNNTVYNCYYGIYQNGGTAWSKNNISYNNTHNYSKTGILDGDYNLSGPGTDPDMPGSHSRNGVNVSFLSTASGSEDFHLANTDTNARGYGTNLSQDSNLAFSNDIDGYQRTGNWDIGADEFDPGMINSPSLPGGEVTINMSLTDKLTNGLVGMWSFDGPDISGTTAYDRSVYGNNGTIYGGATPAIGKNGQALSFDGNNDYVSVPYNATLEPADVSVSAWFKTSANPSGDMQIASKRLFSTQGSYSLGLKQSNSWKIEWGSYDSSWDLVYSDVSNYNDGRWHHIVGVNDGMVNKLYVDGVLQTQTDSDATLTYDQDSLFIGSYNPPGPGQSWFNGLIDEVRVYNRALSPDEVGDLYRLGKVTLKK